MFVNGVEEQIENDAEVDKLLCLHTLTGAGEVKYDAEPSYSGTNYAGWTGTTHSGSLKRFERDIPVYKVKNEFGDDNDWDDFNEELHCTIEIASKYDNSNATDFGQLQMNESDT